MIRFIIPYNEIDFIYANKNMYHTSDSNLITLIKHKNEIDFFLF